MKQIIALFLVAAAASAAAGTSLHYRNDDWHYQFDAPSDWVAIPAATLRDRGFDGGEGAGPAPAPVAGFQAPHESWFHVPAVVITHFPGPAQRPKQVREELARDLHLGAGRSLVHEDHRGMVMVSERVPSSDGGDLRRLAVFRPGVEGVVHIDFYLPPGSMPAWVEPQVRALLDSFHFDEGFATADLAPGESAPLREELGNILRAKPRIAVILGLGILSMMAGIVRRLRA